MIDEGPDYLSILMRFVFGALLLMFGVSIYCCFVINENLKMPHYVESPQRESLFIISMIGFGVVSWLFGDTFRPRIDSQKHL